MSGLTQLGETLEAGKDLQVKKPRKHGPSKRDPWELPSDEDDADGSPAKEKKQHY